LTLFCRYAKITSSKDNVCVSSGLIEKLAHKDLCKRADSW